MYSYFYRIPLRKSTNIRAAMRGKTKKTGTGFCKKKMAADVSTTVAVLPAKIYGGGPKYLATLATTKGMLDCLKNPDTGLE